MKRFAHAWMMTLAPAGLALWLGCGSGDPTTGSTFPPTSGAGGSASSTGGAGGVGGQGGDPSDGGCVPGTACEDAGICGVTGTCEQRCEASPECQSIIPPICGHYDCVEGGCHVGFAPNGALCPLDDGGNGTCYGGLCVPQHE